MRRAAPPGVTDTEDRYYGMLAGAAAARVLESVEAVGLAPLLARGKALKPEAIATALKLDVKRAWKWFGLLEQMGLLEREGAARYRAGPLMRSMFSPQGKLLFFYRDFLRYFNVVMGFDLAAVLRGAPVAGVPYPPQTPLEVELLEAWMRTTAQGTLARMERAIRFSAVSRLLDVAGGDATMAIAQARRHPRLHVTVFNLPASAALARKNVAAARLQKRIDVVEGDFRRDPLPRGYDMVRFSRVLADWPEEVCGMLLAKAHASLEPRGRVLICEPLADDNPALVFAWHFSYLPYDDFGVGVYKPAAAYRRLLADAGFRRVTVKPRDRESIHSVIVAAK
ncbi:MAG TPA: methyltransferase [Burkholderiales bacterium]|nr:methyltransferase [Burkholderiales bacterium]